MNYFKSLENDPSHNYLMSSPTKAAVLSNAAITGNAFILGGSNNRALIITAGDYIYLQSYDTLILRYNRKTGDIEKLWNEYTPTTLKHINVFMQSITGQKNAFNKAAWMSFQGVKAS